MKKRSRPQFITRYKFSGDKSKPNRFLETARIGGVYVSRLTMEPGVVSGNLYHKETNVIFFVTKGRVLSKFVDMKTGDRMEFISEPGSGILHHPPYVAVANINILNEESVIILFSNKQLRKDDDFRYNVHEAG